MSNTKKRIASPNTQRNTAGKRKKANQNVIAFRTFQKNHKTEVEYLKVCSNCKTEFRTENKKVQTCCDTCQQSNKIRGYGQHEFYRTKIADDFNPEKYLKRNENHKKQPLIKDEICRILYIERDLGDVVLSFGLSGNYNVPYPEGQDIFWDLYEGSKSDFLREEDTEKLFLVERIFLADENFKEYYIDLFSNFTYTISDSDNLMDNLTLRQFNHEHILSKI